MALCVFVFVCRETYERERVNVRGLAKEQQTLMKTISMKVSVCAMCNVDF